MLGGAGNGSNENFLFGNSIPKIFPEFPSDFYCLFYDFSIDKQIFVRENVSQGKLLHTLR